MAADDTGQPQSKRKEVSTVADPHARTLLTRKHPISSSLFPPASVRRAAATTAGHPEPGQPPVSAGSSTRRSSVCPAQVAPVHPVQDGSGGDPVVGGRLAVLPHVIAPSSSERRASPPKPKKEGEKFAALGIIFGLG